MKLLFFAGGGYALLLALVYANQPNMLYLPGTPGRALDATPRDIGLEYEDVNLETADGVRIHGWFLPGASARTLLFFHGNAGNISHRLDTIRQFVGLGLSVLIIDYRGYGQSEGKPTEQGMYRDAEAAWEYLTNDRGIPAGQVIIAGRSLGGSIAAWLAAQHTPAALIVDSAFTSVPDIGQEAYPWLPVKLLSRFQHATRDYVTEADCPVLVVHSRDDETIRFHHGQAIFAAAGEPKTFVEIRGGHNDAHFTSAWIYLDGLRQFLDTL